MTRHEIVEKLKEIITEANGGEDERIAGCTEQSRLVTDLGFSSVDILYMVIAIEETLGVRFENVAMKDVDTLGKVVDYIEARLG